jgi:hypothetical protein
MDDNWAVDRVPRYVPPVSAASCLSGAGENWELSIPTV